MVVTDDHREATARQTSCFLVRVLIAVARPRRPPRCGAAPAGIQRLAPQPLERGVVPVLGSPPLDGVGHRARASRCADRLGCGVDVTLQLAMSPDSAEGLASPIASLRAPVERAERDSKVSWRGALVAACQAPAPAPARGSLLAVFDGKFRKPIDLAVKPIGDGLRRTRLTPDHLTIAGLAVGVGAAFAIGLGYLQLGLFLVVLAALPDLLDGALAKASGAASQRGAFFDSTVDRITDAVLFGGVTWYIAVNWSPELTLLPFSIMAISSLISYQRAKAESLGLEAKGGLMERAERGCCCASACSSSRC